MTWTVTATNDGSKLVLDEPLSLEPGTRPVADERSSDAPPGLPSSTLRYR